ncbi:unnamed protein product, partial [Arabis nemorensis]
MINLLFHRHPDLYVDSFLNVDLKTLDAVMNNVINNYIAWRNAILLPSTSLHIEEENDTTKKLSYLGLYLLIWGEASNLRLMPECLCYIYHHMASELPKISEDNPKLVCNDGDEAAFLRKVVTPIYNTIAKEARTGSGGKHSIARNYDDLNEFFWYSRVKSECLQLGWPMDTAHPFFAQQVGNDELQLSSTYISAGKKDIACQQMLIVKYILMAVIGPALVLGLTQLSGYPLIVVIVIQLILKIFPALIFCWPSLQRVNVLMWWYQPQLYIGNDMRENTSFVKYRMLFWIVLLIPKFAFSYYVEILPLIAPTKEIMLLNISLDRLPKLFPPVVNKIALVFSLWSPTILIYFMDTLLWYATLSTLVGGMSGVLIRLGEDCLVPIGATQSVNALFNPMWNTIVASFREEDLINNWELELMLMPCWKTLDAAKKEVPRIRWPISLVANKIPMALAMAKANQNKLQRKLDAGTDIYMSAAIRDCYAFFQMILRSLGTGFIKYPEALEEIFTTIDGYGKKGTLISKLDWSACSDFYDQLVKLTEHLLNYVNEPSPAKVSLSKTSLILVKMFEVMESLMTNEKLTVPGVNLHSYHDEAPYLVDLGTEDWKKNLKRFYLLLTLNDPVMNVPSNMEARRRLTFFSNSLFMEMPRAPTIRNMVSFSALTPYYSEDVIFSDAGLKEKNEDGMSILFYLQKNFSDEWKNFLERVGCDKAEKIDLSDDLKVERRLWASYRGQTLARTVRGMMYYQKALELQAFYDRASDEELMEGYESSSETIMDACQQVVKEKFNYVVSCQQYGIHKGSQDPRAEDIQRLLTMYPYLRVAYVDEEVKGNPREEGTLEKNYYSVLVGPLLVEQEIFNEEESNGAQYAASERNKDEEESGRAEYAASERNKDEEWKTELEYFRIKLPGNPIIGEGKPENQNHAIIFTRGEALQTIDMNQDNYMEEAFKMRNLLQELHRTDGGLRCPTILGLRVHIFTGSVSSLAWFMSNQENSFVTLGQRVLASPLNVRFHYGHPDVFDRVFHLTRGGVSKASKTINLSEDIFGGFNSTLRGGRITHHEYIQVGKGRDVGLHQISMFEAKISNGSGEQILSRDMYRLGTQLGFIRMLSLYFTTVGFYFCSMLMVFAVYTFLYGRLYLVLSGVEENLLSHTRDTKALHNALAPQSIVQIGFLTVLPTIMVIGVENGFHNALFDFVLMQLRLAPVFFTFQLGTRVHYFGRTLLHGGAGYRGTGRGFVMGYAKFSENYRFYSRSHFVKGFEMAILLLVYHGFGSTHLLVTFSIWLMVGSWLFVPFLFNPSGFEWHKIHEDWTDWINWIYDTDSEGISVPPEKSWKSWWKKEQEYLQDSGTFGFMCEIVLASRFFIFPYWLVYLLTPFEKNQSIW